MGSHPTPVLQLLEAGVSPGIRWGLQGEFKETGGGDKAQGPGQGCSLGWPAQGTLTHKREARRRGVPHTGPETLRPRPKQYPRPHQKSAPHAGRNQP